MMPVTPSEEQPTAAERRASVLSASGRIANVLALIGSLLVMLMGWGMNNQFFVRSAPGAPAMVPATSLCVLALSVAYLLPWEKRQSRIPSLILSGIVAIYALYALLAPAVFFGGPAAETGDRVSRVTALCLAFLSFSELSRKLPRLSTWIATVGILPALVGLEGYIFSTKALKETPIFDGLSLQTTLCLTLLFIAMLLRPPLRGWPRILTRDGASGILARRTIWLAAFLPPLLTWMALYLTGQDLLAPDIRLAVMSVAFAFVATTLLLREAGTLHQRDTDQRSHVAELQAILDGLDAAVFVFGSPGLAVITNKAARQLAGRDADALRWLRETPFHRLDTRAVLPTASKPMARMIDGRETDSLFVGYMDPTGAEHALHFTSSESRAAPGTPLLRILSISDATEAWVLRENVSRTERFDALGQLASGVAHEMSNILGAIRLSADTGLLKGDEERLRRLLSNIQGACVRGVSLTGRLLTLSRTTGREEGTCDLQDAVTETMALARPSVPAQFDLTSDLPEGPIPLVGDGSDLGVALLNLILNARNALTDAKRIEGRILLSAHQAGDEMHISVTDDGPGMSQEVRARALEPFYTTRQDKGGSGLGLALVVDVARRAGGRFVLTSEPDKGTEATLIIPMTTPHEETETAADHEETDLTGLRFLVVEDDPHFGTVMCDALNLLGAEVEFATDAVTALQILEGKGPFRIFLTDIVLGGPMDGHALAAEAVRRQPDLRVIYMTGYNASYSDIPPQVPGLVLRKPASLDAMQNAVRLTLGEDQVRQSDHRLATEPT